MIQIMVAYLVNAGECSLIMRTSLIVFVNRSYLDKFYLVSSIMVILSQGLVNHGFMILTFSFPVLPGSPGVGFDGLRSVEHLDHHRTPIYSFRTHLFDDGL